MRPASLAVGLIGTVGAIRLARAMWSTTRTFECRCGARVDLRLAVVHLEAHRMESFVLASMAISGTDAESAAALDRMDRILGIA